MILVFCISTRDQELGLKNVQWWNELGGCKAHEEFFIYDKRCKPEIYNGVKAELEMCFKEVHALQAGAEMDGWPEGANYFFRLASGTLQNKDYTHFMWMEPDAIPLSSGWLDKIESEFLACNKPFMGDRVEVGDIPLHMSGVGIYPNPLHAFAVGFSGEGVERIGIDSH